MHVMILTYTGLIIIVVVIILLRSYRLPLGINMLYSEIFNLKV